MRTLNPRGLLRGLAVAALGLATLAPAANAERGTVQAQLLAINDFHGHLESTTPGTIIPEAGALPVPAGGSEYLATHIRALEAETPNSLLISAGDLVGASPLLSALFHDEPTVEAMNRIGLDLNAVGNHEFDEGAAELRRLQRGGCHPTDGCLDGDGFAGADFRFLAANVVNERGRPFFRPYAVRRMGGVKVGFIGMTLEATPTIVSAAGIQGLRFLDEAETANRYARELRRRHGVQAIVVVLHEGGVQASPFGIDTCNAITGPVVDIVNRTTDEVDLFVTGHTHQPYTCEIDGRPVTSAASFGRLVTDIDLTLDRRSGEVVSVAADNKVISRDVARAEDLTQLIARYDQVAAPLRERVIGRVETALTRAADDSGESTAGNMIADAQLAATEAPDRGGAVAAFMNPGGVRADLDAGEVTFGEAFTVQPFGNNLTTLTLTGAQLSEMLKQQWCGQAFRRILLPSRTVSYAFSASVASETLGRPCASSPNPVSDLRIAGEPVTDEASYRITVNSFLADGGDLFTVLTQGTNRLGGPLDLDALEAYLGTTLQGAPLPAPALDRITVTP